MRRSPAALTRLLTRTQRFELLQAKPWDLGGFYLRRRCSPRVQARFLELKLVGADATILTKLGEQVRAELLADPDEACRHPSPSKVPHSGREVHS